jgi:hypothetical protein
MQCKRCKGPLGHENERSPYCVGCFDRAMEHPGARAQVERLTEDFLTDLLTPGHVPPGAVVLKVVNAQMGAGEAARLILGL